MSEVITIRACEVEDLPVVSRLLCETWHATYDPIYGAEKVDAINAQWHTPSMLAGRLGAPRSLFLVAQSGEALAGMAFIRVSEDVRSATLHQLYVHPAHQRLGVGKKLIDRVLVHAGPHCRLVLEVEPENLRAIAFYEAHGFRITGDGVDCGNMGAGIAYLEMTRAEA
ncbi:MAG: GNAT family N-acetyltransferase [Pseudomonadota bacterium]